MSAKSRDEVLLEQLIDQRLAQPLDVHRRARGEVLEAAAQARRARRVVAAPDDFLLVAVQRAAAHRALGRHLPGLAARPRLRARIGFTTFGMTSPPFSMRTRSPSRRSLRAMSSALCSVAIEIVEPARNTGSSTAYGVTAPVRPTLTSILRSVGRRLLRRELERRRPARELRGRPEPFAQREVVHLDDDAVGVELERRGASRPTPGRRRSTASTPAQARQCGSTGSPHARIAVSISHACRLRRSSRRSAPELGHDLIGERRQPALRDERRIEVAHRAGGGVARVGEQRLAGLLALAVRPLERRPRQEHLAAHLDPARRAVLAARSGIARMVRTLAVTSSPRVPSPRVAPRTSTPSS